MADKQLALKVAREYCGRWIDDDLDDRDEAVKQLADLLIEYGRAERLDEAQWWHKAEMMEEHSCEQELRLATKGYARFTKGCQRIYSLQPAKGEGTK